MLSSQGNFGILHFCAILELLSDVACGLNTDEFFSQSFDFDCCAHCQSGFQAIYVFSILIEYAT